MNRRALLALCGGGLVGLAGCVSREGDGTEPTTSADGSPATNPGDTSPTATPAETDLAVELDALQPALVVLNVDYLEPYAKPASQYLYLHLSASTSPGPALSALSFRFDGESHAPMGVEGLPNVYRGFDSTAPPQYDPEEGSGWVLFELPETGDAGDAALVGPGGEWRPDERLRTRLAAASPSLSVEQWDVAPTVALDDRTTFRIAVENTGDVAGRFVGGVNADGWEPHRPAAAISREIPPGETATWEVPGEEVELVADGMADQVGDGEADIHYELVWSGGSRSADVRVVEE